MTICMNQPSISRSAAGSVRADHKSLCRVLRWRSHFVLVALIYFALPLICQAVNPPPGGGYPGFNTAVGQSALFSLTTGVWNTAIGGYTLFKDTTGSGNTAVGLGALGLNVSGNFNTAVGLGALFSNNGDPTASEASNNCAFGAYALFANTTGYHNNAFGSSALALNTTGANNNAFGYQALVHHVSGSGNNAFGMWALCEDESGQGNNAFGFGALTANISGSGNTAAGDNALEHYSGNSNTALGSRAGWLATSGSGNVYIGSGTDGVAGESNHTYIRNINTAMVSGDAVTIDLFTGLLGHASSSRRYKEEVKPIGNDSEAIYRLRPVSFRYKKEINPGQSLEYGLIAEDVAEVNPNLAIRDGENRVESVRYNAVSAMLLNEFLKEHNTVQDRVGKMQEQENAIRQLEANAARQEAAIALEHKRLRSKLAERARQIEALASGLQEVVAEVETSRLTPQAAATDR
jgi:trimeric autotransporter adhesin